MYVLYIYSINMKSNITEIYQIQTIRKSLYKKNILFINSFVLYEYIFECAS